MPEVGMTLVGFNVSMAARLSDPEISLGKGHRCERVKPLKGEGKQGGVVGNRREHLLLESRCWCDKHATFVTREQVLIGQTESCHRKACQVLAGAA